jgi:hypothetical protein
MPVEHDDANRSDVVEGELRILDTALGERLGFPQPQDIWNTECVLGLIRRDFRVGVQSLVHFSTAGLLLSERVRFAPHQPPPIAIRS